MKTYEHKTQRTRNAQLTYYSLIKNLLKSILFRDERKQWRERKSSLLSGRLFHTFTTRHAKKCLKIRTFCAFRRRFSYRCRVHETRQTPLMLMSTALRSDASPSEPTRSCLKSQSHKHRGRHANFLGGPNIYGPRCRLHHFWHTTI